MRFFKSLIVCASICVVGSGFVPAHAARQCDLPAPVNISIEPATAKLEMDYSRSLTDIQKVKTDTVDPYGIHSNSITQGFMEGQISMKRTVDLDYDTHMGGRKVCLWYKSIDIAIDIKPKIVIASEVKRDRCMHKAVLDHEKKHVDVDRDLVNEYAKIIGQDLYKALKQKGFVSKPVAAKDAQAEANKMVKFIMDFTQDKYAQLGQERMKRQGAVDSLEEYERVKGLCPDFYKHKMLLYQKALKQKQQQKQQQQGNSKKLYLSP